MITENVEENIAVQGRKRRRQNLFRKLFCLLPGITFIRRVLLINDAEKDEENQESGFARKSSATDLFYPIRLAKLQSFRASPATYFYDGVQKIDFVLVYEISFAKESEKKSKFNFKTHKSEETAAKRDNFLLSLKIAGIKMEEDVLFLRNHEIHFIKLSAPWSVLTVYAESLQIRVPVEIQPEIVRNWSTVFFQYFNFNNFMTQFVPEEPLNFYTCPFKKDRLKHYLWSDEKDSFFSTTQRIQIVNELLQTAPFGRTKKAEIGISRLVEEGVFSAAYPLHDGEWDIKNGQDYFNLRYILHQYWARWRCWYKYQPIHHIRKYFGEKIALYFAFLGFYTSWLTVFALFGLIIFLVQIFQMFWNPLVQVMCSSGTDYKICATCSGCSEWYLSELCLYHRTVAVVDCVPMIFFAIFSSFWTVSFLANWKRTNAVLSYQWSSHNVVWEDQRPRAGFIIAAPFLCINPITGKTEPHFPHEQRNYRIVLTTSCVLGMILVVIISVVLLVMFRSMIEHQFSGNTFAETPTVKVIVEETMASIIQFFIMLILGRTYTKMAMKFTAWEMHRTEVEFENALIIKIFIFQFVNYFSPFFYIAFFKNKYPLHPDKPEYIFNIEGMPVSYCSGGSCFLEITVQLAIILIAKQAINNFSMFIFPKMKKICCRPKIKQEPFQAQWIRDYYLNEHSGLVNEYLEIVLQFAFITLFVCAFPLSPIFALINNWLQIRLDAQKMLYNSKRPVPQQTQGLEVWFSIMSSIALISTITNAFIIAFTSDIFPQLVYDIHYGLNPREYLNFTLPYAHLELKDCRQNNYLDENGQSSHFFWVLTTYRLLFVVLYEHIIIGISTITQMLVPEIPKKLKIRMKRENFISRKTVSDIGVNFDVSQEIPQKISILPPWSFRQKPISHSETSYEK